MMCYMMSCSYIYVNKNCRRENTAASKPLGVYHHLLQDLHVIGCNEQLTRQIKNNAAYFGLILVKLRPI